MNKMIVYKTPKCEIYIPLDENNKPDLSKVPFDYQVQLSKFCWDICVVKTSKDREIFKEVIKQGYSIQKIVCCFEERV